MISAETGGRLKVTGSSIAMVADRAEAGQHADQRAEEHADEAVEEVQPRGRGAEAEREMGDQVQCYLPSSPSDLRSAVFG